MFSKHTITAGAAAIFMCLALCWFSSGCSYTKIADAEKSSPAVDSQLVINNYQPAGDSLFQPGFYYRYLFTSKEQWDRQTDWFLANLRHYDIGFHDAWYIVTDRPDRGKNYRLPTSFPPGLVVVLTADNPDILQHHFVKCAPLPLAAFEGWTHYDSLGRQ